MLKQVVILAGGFGTRLGELTKRTPKPLLPVGERPFLEYVVWNLKRHGINKILFSAGYLAEQIVECFGDGSRYGVSFDYVFEQEPAGTGGALLLAEQKLDEVFLVVNGDTLFDLNYLDLALLLERSSALAALALRFVPDVGRYGGVRLERDYIKGFSEKSKCGPGLVNGGVYVMCREALGKLSRIPCSLERDLFPDLAIEGKLVGKSYDNFFIDIGLPESLREANLLVPQWQFKPAVFLDRDGVLNLDYGYVHRPEEFCWVDGAVDAVKWLNDHGYLVVVITNQAGIARGYYSEDEFISFADWINEQLKEKGAHIDATYYCPHHPTEGYGQYLKSCNCRKPEPGLIERALTEWRIDKQRSILIGDKNSDLDAARSASIEGVLFTGQNLLEFLLGVIPS